MSEFLNLYSHGFARLAVATPRCASAARRATSRRREELMRRGGARARRCWRCFRSSGFRPTPATTSFTSRRSSRPPSRRWRTSCVARRALPLAGAGGPAGGGGRPALQLRRPRVPGPADRRGAQDLPAELPRVLRGPAVHAGRHQPAHGRSASPARTRPFGAGLLFRLAEMKAFVLHVEICEDLWVPAPPSSFACASPAPR